MIKCFILGFNNNGTNLDVIAIMRDSSNTSNDRGYFAEFPTNYSDTIASIVASIPSKIAAACTADGIPTPDSYEWLDPMAGATPKRAETYSGTSNGSGNYTVTFGTAFAVAPNIQANVVNGTDTQTVRITSVSTTGFTVLVRNRTDVLGLLPSYSNVSGAAVDVLITEK